MTRRHSFGAPNSVGFSLVALLSLPHILLPLLFMASPSPSLSFFLPLCTTRRSSSSKIFIALSALVSRQVFLLYSCQKSGKDRQEC